jgi:hypothetical protein
MDVLGNCHITYTKKIYTVDNGEVYYAEQNGGVWQTPVNLSQSEAASSEASIDVYGGKVYVTWTEEEAAGKQVWRSSKYVGELIWTQKPCSEIGTNGSIGAYNPFCATGIAMWAENIDNANYAVKYLRPDAGATVQTLAAVNGKYLTYLQGTLAMDGSTVLGSWSEVLSGGESGPWITEIKSAGGIGKKVAYLEVEAGTVEPTPYTVSRDGYTTYPSGISVDYSTTELVYELPYLNPDADYTLQVVGYHESSEKWNEQVKIDGLMTKVLKVTAHVPETLRIDIPRGYFADDKKVTLNIRRLTGDYAAVSNISIFRTEIASQPGSIKKSQSIAEAKTGTAPSFMLGTCYPNPVKGSTSISFQIPQAGKVSLKVYNIQGQLVKMLVDDVKQAGIHNATWDCKNDVGQRVSNGIYLYRLCTGENTQTQKITVLK